MELQEIKNLSDMSIVTSLESFFAQERKVSGVILLHLKIIAERRIFAKRGYSTLFEMLIKYFKLSETSANQRLKALELLEVVPEAAESFMRNELNLTTLAMAQRQINREEKIKGEKVSVEEKIEIVSKIKNKTQHEAEVELMKLLPNTASNPRSVKKRISEDAVRVSFNMPDRVRAKLQRLQELWAHINPSMDDIELIERALDKTLTQIDPLMKKKKEEKKEAGKEVEKKPPHAEGHNRSVVQEDNSSEVLKASTEETENKSILSEVKGGEVNEIKESKASAVNDEASGVDKVEELVLRPTYFSVETRTTLLDRAYHCCQFVDPITKNRCASRRALQIDHEIPLALGGTNEISNLRILCRTHNLLMAREHFGATKIDREIRRRM